MLMPKVSRCLLAAPNAGVHGRRDRGEGVPLACRAASNKYDNRFCFLLDSNQSEPSASSKTKQGAVAVRCNDLLGWLESRLHPLPYNDVCFSTSYDGLQFFLLRLRHIKFVERLLEILKESLPLGVVNHQILVRITHGTAAVTLW